MENTDSTSTFQLIYDVVKNIPCGKVATYGQIAAYAGNPRWARVVGYALHVNPEPGVIPCHRVVNRHGMTAEGFAFGGRAAQSALLALEGVETDGEGRVDLKKYQWQPDNDVK